MQNLSELTRRLVEAQAEFVLIGGFAAVAHGVTLVTRVPFRREAPRPHADRSRDESLRTQSFHSALNSSSSHFAFSMRLELGRGRLVPGLR